tara:strand:+ start:5188 stop:7104 length:1917 start_codon:yes stop_codon:yes gene_type:complete
MAEKIILKVVADTTKANKDIGKVGQGAGAAAKETTLLSGAMASLTGVMTKVKATSKLMFGTIRAGIISTGIGALVIAFVALITYFTKTKKGAEKLEVIFAVVGAVVNVIVDRISKFGSAISNFFSGNWSAAADDMSAAFSGVGDEIMNEVEASIRLKREMQELTDLTREFGIEKAQTRQEIEKARLAAEDESLSAEERLKNLKKALDLEAQTTEKELSLQRRRVAAKEEEVAMSESTQEDLQALADEKIKLIEMETASVKMRKRVITEVNSLENEIAAEEKARQDARRARYKARKKQRETEAGELLKLNQDIELMEIVDADDRAKRALEIQRENDVKAAKEKKNSKEQIKAINDKYDLLELDRIKKIEEKKKAEQDKEDDKTEKAIEDSNKRLLELQQANTLLSIEDAQLKADKQLEIQMQKELDSVANMENSEALKAEIVKKYEHIKQKQKEATAKIEQQQNLQAIAAVQSTLGGMAGLYNEGSKKWKALKTGEAMIGTFLGAQKAYTATAGIPLVGPFLAPINAAIAVAAGIAQVKKIQSTEIPKMNRGGMVGGYGSGTSDSVNTRLSKGEAVINARSAKMFRGALSSMNVAGGGVSFAGEDDNNSGGGVVKAYVLNDEMTSAQDRTAKIKRRSSI